MGVVVVGGSGELGGWGGEVTCYRLFETAVDS